jgi:hypothetical protein
MTSFVSTSPDALTSLVMPSVIRWETLVLVTIHREKEMVEVKEMEPVELL